MSVQEIDTKLTETLREIIAIIKKEFPDSESDQKEILKDILTITI